MLSFVVVVVGGFYVTVVVVVGDVDVAGCSWCHVVVHVVGWRCCCCCI